jgi:hypothetical protein
VALDGLEGRETSRGRLRLADVKRGRFPEERDAVVLAGDDGKPAIRLKHFGGRRSAGVLPWIEASVAPGEDEAYRAELVAALAALVPPGGYLMISYGDDETERGLKRRFPPAVTPLGKALLDAGCTWFKDWYYPEGWLEGGMKLQGNKPASPERAAEGLAAIRAEVEEWLEAAPSAADSDDHVLSHARERAAEILGRS